MRLRGLASAAIAIAVALGAAAAVRADVPGEGSAREAAIDRARGEVLDAEYQSELPGRDHDLAGRTPGALRPGGRALDAEHDRRTGRPLLDTRLHDDAGGSSLMTFVMWALVIVVGLLTAMWLTSELARYGGDAELAPDAEARERMAAASAAIIDRPLGDADELARRGAFAEAIHTLLLRTLQELAHSAAVRVGPATTSREILARVPLLADARTALAGLITAVEITHFGAEPASAADYERCRDQFHVFAAAFRGARRPGAVAA